MTHNDSLIIDFHKKLFLWAETYLIKEYREKFSGLREIGIPLCNVAVEFMSRMEPNDFQSFARFIVRRCYQPELLQWFGEDEGMHDNLALKEYDNFWRTAPREEGLEGVHIFTAREKTDIIKMFRVHYPHVINISGGLEFINEIGKFKIVTFLDISHRGGRISYCHRSISYNGIQLNVIPISVLSWCGISSATKWQSHFKTGSDSIFKIVTKHTSRLLEFLALIGYE